MTVLSNFHTQGIEYPEIHISYKNRLCAVTHFISFVVQPFSMFFPRNICKSSFCGPFGTKFDNLKVICCPTFAQITSGEPSSSHSINCLPPNLFSLFFSKKSLKSIQFQLCWQSWHWFPMHWSFIFKCRAQICLISSRPLQWESFSHINAPSWFPESFSTCHSVKVSWRVSSFLYFESSCVFICSGLALSPWTYPIFEQSSIEQFNLPNS